MAVKRIADNTKRLKIKKKKKYINKTGDELSDAIIKKLTISLLEEHGYIKKRINQWHKK